LTDLVHFWESDNRHVVKQQTQFYLNSIYDTVADGGGGGGDVRRR